MKFSFKHFTYRAILVLMVVQFASILASAQSTNILYQSNQMRMANGIIRIAEPGQVADTVNIWGDVRDSGRFLIPRATTLSQLISYAGGPVLFRSEDTVIDWSVVKLEVSLTKVDSTDGSVYKNFVFAYSDKVPEEFKSISLNNNDIVVIQVKRQRNWRDYLQVIAPIATTLMTTILLYDRIKSVF